MTATTKPELPQAVDDFFFKDIPEPFQILDVTLLPFSIGRYRRMARHGIGFVSEGESRADGKDLLLGVLICSMKCRRPDSDKDKSNLYWDEVETSPGKISEIIASWMRQINAVPPWYLRGRYGGILSATWIGRRWRKNNSFDLLEKCRLFQNYIQEAQTFPKFIRKQQGGGMSACHWTHNIEVTLMGELNWRHEDIEERPLSKALADYFKHLENQGLITILTESDYDQIRHNDAIASAALAAVAKKKEAANGL